MSRLPIHRILAAIGLALGVWAVARSAGGAAPEPPAGNPHWQPNSCVTCHGDGHPKAIGLAPAQALCLRCHNGRSASAEVHPVGRAIPAQRMDFPAKWPLLDGRLACGTCHDMKLACSVDIRRDYANPAMLRITRVGHEEKPFCQSCHKPQELPRLNPHRMLTADRQTIESQCAICHTQPMDRKESARTGNAMLRAKEIQFCKSCHPQHKEQFQPGHVGHPVKPEFMAFMKAREMVGLAAPPAKQLVEELKKAGERPKLLPLAPDNTLTCSTCHNPHQLGTFAPGTPLAYRPMRIVDGKTISPVRAENWCNHCHDMN